MFGIKSRRQVRRPAVEGEVCTCGKPAAVVFDHPALGIEVGTCLQLDPEPRTRACPFCGTTGEHTTKGICPVYSVRPAWATPAAQRALCAESGVVHQVAEEMR